MFVFDRLVTDILWVECVDVYYVFDASKNNNTFVKDLF